MLLPNHQDSTVDGNGRFLTHVFIISISRSALFRFSSFLRSSGGSERIRSPWCSNTSQPVVQVTTSKWSEEEEEDGPMGQYLCCMHLFFLCFCMFRAHSLVSPVAYAGLPVAIACKPFIILDPSLQTLAVLSCPAKLELIILNHRAPGVVTVADHGAGRQQPEDFTRCVI